MPKVGHLSVPIVETFIRTDFQVWSTHPPLRSGELFEHLAAHSQNSNKVGTEWSFELTWEVITIMSERRSVSGKGKGIIFGDLNTIDARRCNVQQEVASATWKYSFSCIDIRGH